MDFITLKKRAAQKLNLLDASDNVLTGKDITETDLGQSINDAYAEDVYPLLQTQYPHDFEQIAYASNYSVTGTADVASTGTTLVATTAIFTQAMEGLYIENATDSTYAKISSYTNTTTVTLDTTIGNTWDGDSLRVLDRDYTFGGDATDAYALRSVWTRYKSTDPYIRVTQRNFNDVFQDGRETFNSASPIYTLQTVDVSGVPTKAFSIYPLFTVSDSRAVKIVYLEKPTLLSANGDVPSALPLGHQVFLYWKAVEDGAISRRDAKLAALAKQNYEEGKAYLLANYRPTSFDRNVGIRIPRRWARMASRRI